MKVSSKTFKTIAFRQETYESMYKEATNFASEIGPERLINISTANVVEKSTYSTSFYNSVTVFYWEN